MKDDTTLTCVCGATESAPTLKALEAKGWAELSPSHCATCECSHFYCPAHAPLVKAIFKRHQP